MHNLKHVRNNGLDIIIDFSIGIGEVFASYETVSMVVGVSIESVMEVIRCFEEPPIVTGTDLYPNDPTLARAIDAMGTNIRSIHTDALEDHGFLNENQITAVMASYFPALLDNCIQLYGIRGFFHELAGFEINFNKY
jgi:hypothetical protein